MENERIILNERIRLMEQGIIKATNKFIVIEDENGKKKKIKEPQEIHTYSEWKNLNRYVKKNEKAIAKFPIWVHINKVTEELNSREEEDRFYLKNAYWFTIEQTEQIEQKK